MDVFTDVDIFKEIVDASVRGVPVYVLLDDFQFKSFLAMAEKQTIQLQRLRNMRVRTVKGQEYLCRTGAKFHGTMQQKFILFDCHTVVYGSYSFMWSYEKINLSMVQVITGQLVQSYDEEFRMLFARSTVPAVLCPPQTILQEARHISSQPFERRDQLRHTLDVVYMRACGSQARLKNPVEDFEHELHNQGPFSQRIANGHTVQNRIHQLQSAETSSFLKRHSYAGERNENSYIPMPMTYGTSNWNVARECNQFGAPGRNGFLSRGVEHPLQSGRLYQNYNRATNARQSFHGHDKQIVSMQQNLPSLERTTKSFLRTWRIESYLNNNEPPVADSNEYLDHCEVLDAQPPSYLHSRMRSSLVFKSTIPEQPESNSYTSTSQTSTLQGDPPSIHSSTEFQSSTHRIPAVGVGNRMMNDDFMMKRRSFQIIDEPRNNVYNGYKPTAYSSLGRTKGGLSVKNPEIFHSDRFKRYSLVDPRPNTDYITSKESSSHVYGILRSGQVGAGSGSNDIANSYSPNLNDDHRSASHSDVKYGKSKDHSSTVWQEPPSRTVSATALSTSNQEPALKSSNANSQQIFKKSSKKIISLLNMSEKRVGSSLGKKGLNSKMSGSSDTQMSEDEVKRSGKKKSICDSTASSIKSIGSSSHKGNEKVLLNQNHYIKGAGTSSTPRFSTEELHDSSAPSDTSVEGKAPSSSSLSSRLTPASEFHQRDTKGEKRLYSRFEPFCSFEKNSSDKQPTVSTHLHSFERHKTLVGHSTRENLVNDHNINLRNHSLGHHDNKLGRFIQRVGNFIHKNK
ncbi:protein FAM83B [Arapaima gigas]